MIDVAMTRADVRPVDVAVVVDVLRATSTATQALAAGYSTVLFAESVELAATLRTPARVLAGELDCVTPPGFDLGNSPLEHRRPRGDQLVLSTTNGAPAIVAATRRADAVLLACLLNLDAVVTVLREAGDQPDASIQIVCSGTDGAPALEDVYLAGRVSASLEGPRTDAALVAEAVARAYSTPLAALSSGSHAARLRAAGMAPDIVYCARESVLDLVPAVLGATRGTATVGARAVDGTGSVRTVDADAPPMLRLRLAAAQDLQARG